MQPSPEIRDLVMRSLQWRAEQNVAAIMDVCSREPGFLCVGTQPSEWMTSLADTEAMVRAAVEGGSGRVPDDLVMEAYQEGTVGWAGYRWTLRLPNGASVILRETDVFHQEGDAWKLVHAHLSVGIPDEQVPSIARPGS